MEEITSRSNARVKAAVQLFSSAAARREEGLFVLEGARLCMEAGQTGIPIRQLFSRAGHWNAIRRRRPFCRKKPLPFF